MNIQDIFDSMEYGPAPESATEAQAWLDSRNRAFGHFINGSFTKPGAGFESRNPATGALLAKLTQASQSDVDAAVVAARTAQPGWTGLGGHKRARYLYALARLLQKHARLFAVLETLDNGKPIRESRDIDIPLAARHFYYHAGMAQLMEDEMPGRAPLGVCGQIIPWNFPLLMLAWKIAPAIAMGNTVVLKPAEFTPLTALLFGQICQEAGLPAGVVNIVTGDGAVGEMIVNAEVDKIAFTGSTVVGRAIREATAGSGKSLTLELGGKSPYIVFEDADLDSAVEGLVDAIWFNQGQVCCAGSRLLVQEGIAERFYAKLKARMETLRIGDPLDKCIDVGSLVDPVQLQTVTRFVQEGAGDGEVFQPAVKMPDGCFYPPTLITGLAPADRLMQEEIFGPVLVSTTFRTPSEAVEIANNTRYGLAASVWSENINLALDIAPKLASGVVWVNATNLFDAAAGFGGVRESGFGREGGWEGLLAYTKPTESAPRAAAIAPFAAPADPSSDNPLDRTAKMFVGGKQARPDSGYSRTIWGPKGALLGHVGEGNRKDIRNAVEAAGKAASWAKSTGHLRAQILFYIAENLSARAAEFAARIDAMTGTKTGAEEVEAAIDLLFTHAAWADKLDGAAKGVPLRGLAVAVNEPVGVIGAVCPPDRPLLGLIAAMAPAVAMGNRVVLLPSEAFPLTATDFYQVLETSDLPAGVVNIVTGAQGALSADIASHLDVDAVWNLSTADLDAAIEKAAARNLKRTWACGLDGAMKGREALTQATEIKTVWVPYGE
ncbi:aldehyde dehydrogenase family protein [Aliiruegeria sabulilitoris]|uniref:aldehyde dehydrogenase family protein n=1 Tax=Aliiruegeria sabulilitoris TaxID=1510458 RepID=UPI000831E231|nr:aldehyde dehydrogenase family protein [Aliiruegeria sabulilitoris]NDR58601.1 aldehyde dehydrogenase family protein [Pseudoruegeria sp. M32A2M]